MYSLHTLVCSFKIFCTLLDGFQCRRIFFPSYKFNRCGMKAWNGVLTLGRSVGQTSFEGLCWRKLEIYFECQNFSFNYLSLFVWSLSNYIKFNMQDSLSLYPLYVYSIIIFITLCCDHIQINLHPCTKMFHDRWNQLCHVDYMYLWIKSVSKISKPFTHNK